MAVLVSLVFMMLFQPSRAAAAEFADANSITLQTRTTYFVNLTIEGQQADLELDVSQYQFLQSLLKLSLSEALPNERHKNYDSIASSINEMAMKRFGKALVMNSENGYHLYRPLPSSENRLFNIFKRSVFYRGEEVTLTDKQIEILRILDAAPNRAMTFEELAQAVGWNGRNFRTNVRSYMDAINLKTMEYAGAELLQVEGRGKLIRIAVIEPNTYTEGGYSRVDGQILRLEPAAFAVAEILSAKIRENLPSNVKVSASELQEINMTPPQILASAKLIYAAAGLPHDNLRLQLTLKNEYRPRDEICMRDLL